MRDPSNDRGDQVLLAIGRLEGRVEQFLIHQSRHEDRLNNHEQRIVVLEKDDQKATGFRAGALAAASALGAAGTWAATHVSNFWSFFK